MGSRLVKYEFSPKENEQIEAVIKVPEEKRSVIHGVVIDCKNRPIRDAVVKLLEVLPGNPCRMRPLTHTFTDNCGQFLFGPLHCNRKYALKIWYSNVKIRELIIAPDCDDHCDDDHFESHSDDSYNDSQNDEYRDGHYDGHCDINFEDYFGRQSEDHYEEKCDTHSDDYNDEEYEEKCEDLGYHTNFDVRGKEENRHERRKDDSRRDRHSDDDNYIHYRAPKVYGQKCSKCELGKNKINSFEDIEK